MADMVHYRTSNHAADRRASTDFCLIVWAAIVSMSMIVVTYALSVVPGIDLDRVLSIFAAA